jgi:hypothetical protein
LKRRVNLALVQIAAIGLITVVVNGLVFRVR